MPTSIRDRLATTAMAPCYSSFSSFVVSALAFRDKGSEIGQNNSAIESLCTSYSAFCANAAQTPEECFHGLGHCNSSVEEQPITIVCMKDQTVLNQKLRGVCGFNPLVPDDCTRRGICAGAIASLLVWGQSVQRVRSQQMTKINQSLAGRH